MEGLARRFRPVPWEDLATPLDVEAWIDAHNRSLQEHIKPNEGGYGVCFSLAAGGKLYLRTSEDGSVLLDVDSEAGWVSPVIAAAVQSPAPRGSLWVLPDDVLIQLVFGLNTLIATSELVVNHAGFGKQRA